ncbi:alpha/beta fold hydrolase [Rhodococcus sp. NPDC058505]|uniref:alpha/beta fold hydrolase n=1 Tax=unclassified Rhodococcus (in: high G+C Gram-positive bacteria) TaxID=192944 RepID=UPI00364BC769
MTFPDPSTVRIDGPWRHCDVRANGIRFHAVEAGPSDTDAPLVVLLHGFADFWWTWRHQLTALADAGYRTVALDLRGYGDTDKPPRGYDGWTLAGDVAGLIRALGHTDAALVGHAEGGLVCWATAVLHPRLVRSIALLASPHPIALKRAVIRSRPQRSALLPSFLACQLPWRPERRLIRDGGAAVEQLLRDRTASTGLMADGEFDEVVARNRSAIQIPGAAHCGLEYQRWAFRSQWRPDGRRFMSAMDRVLQIPVLQIHGDADPYVLRSTLQADTRWAPHRHLHTVPGAGHYPQWERHQDVTAALLGALRNRA